MKKIIFFLFILSGCVKREEVMRKNFFALGTWGEIVCVANKEICQNGIEKAYREIENLENTLSYFKKDSDVYLLNNFPGKPIKVKEETFEVLKKAKEISNKTEGAFDITVASLLEIWGFYEKEKSFYEPDPELINKTLLSVGEDKIVLNESEKTVTLKNNLTKIDLGGIAKGYIVDKVVNILKKEGIKNGLVNLGGDLFCFGEGKDGKGWRIGIQDPDNKEKVVAILKVRDKALATSGQYENFKEIKGKKYGHILDPRTGYPVENEVLSVTVVAEDCLTADALATAIFVLGKEKGISILRNFSVEAVLVSKGKEGIDIWVSPGIEDKIIRGKKWLKIFS